MTVESNYVIAIATHGDWLKRLAPVFQPMRSKKKLLWFWFFDSHLKTALITVQMNESLNDNTLNCIFDIYFPIVPGAGGSFSSGPLSAGRIEIY